MPLHQGHVNREINAGARHHLPLERVTMQVDDAGQREQAACVERMRPATVSAHVGDNAAGDPQRGLGKIPVDERPPALNHKIERTAHDAALRLLVLAGAQSPEPSYLSRNSSTESFLKSGRAL